MATFNGGSGNDTIYGNNKLSDFGGRNDDIFGNAGADKLFGMRGSDRLFGGTGLDLLAGGSGNDTLFGEGGADTFIYESGNDTINGGAQRDTLKFASVAFITSTFDAVASHLILGMAHGIDFDATTGSVKKFGGTSLGSLTLQSVEQLELTSFNDRIVDTDASRSISTFDGADSVFARGGHDAISTGAGDDRIDAGLGRDDINGGDGNDTMNFASWNAVIPGAGKTAVSVITLKQDGSSFTGTALLSSKVLANGQLATIEQDVLTRIENVDGSKFADTIIGNGGVNHLSGKGGNDTISGRGGADDMDGGDGRDTLDYSTSASGIEFNMIRREGQGGEAEGDKGFNFENLTGSAFADTLTGDSGRNVLIGGNGGDTVRGGVGNDTIDGGAGRDFIDGGTGKDQLTGGTGADDFIFRTVTASTSQATDTIKDFVRGQDRIDLSNIDADTLADGNDAFDFLAIDAPDGSTGGIPSTAPAGLLTVFFVELDQDHNGSIDHVMSVVQGHVDANGIADFELKVITTIADGVINGSDFLL